VKHLLILISFLLLSSPVIGHETGVLYQYETSTGIKWKTFGNEKLQPKYEGEIKNGEMDGLGFMTYPYGEKSVVGEWKNGKEWNTKHTKKDGTLIGKWVNGEWIVSWGVLYLGSRNGKYGWYEEEWEGVESNDNKDFGKYEGEIKNGLPNGQGTFTFPNGQKYVGSWKDGRKKGKGTFTWSDGKKYVGEYKDGERNGQGTETFPNGQKYVGSWKNGEYNGQGTFTYPNGQKYVGEYKDGERNGQGTYTFPDGGKYVGEWKNGKRWNGTEYDKDGNIQYKYVNGEYISQ